MQPYDEAAASPRLFFGRRTLLLAAASLAGCATREPARSDGSGWHEVALPGKRATSYQAARKGGRPAVAARADASASLWRKRMDVPPERLGEVSFSWWVDALIAGADAAQADSGDAVARVMFGFDGDLKRLSFRNRLQFELAETLTGEAPPYATLAYVWETRAPVGSVIVNPRSDRLRKIVLDSGATQLGRWRDHRRHLARDYRRVFDEAPGRLRSVALMTDTDNTRAAAQAWYGPVQID
jgi:hypothetical protein